MPFILLTLALSGCGYVSFKIPTLAQRDSLAQAIVRSHQMQKKIIPVHGFLITTYSRITAPQYPVTVYIEGDGFAWLSRSQPSSNPTPINPLALRLAMQDISPNIIYIARPCQFTQGPACKVPYWTNKRFSDEIVTSMNDVLNIFMDNNKLNNVRLVGFSGGGSIAALLAARREDVVDLRTIAGNLDHKKHSSIHKVSTLNGSLNPPDMAETLRHIPQHHFIGGLDKNVTFAIYQSYATALKNSTCLNYTIVPDATHIKKWQEKWQNLSQIHPSCD